MKLFTLLFGLGYALILPAQNTPLFETKIFIHDAQGNMDSLELGFDPNDMLNDTVQFHEVQLNTPFDSVLEMRVVRRIESFQAEDILYKRLILDAVVCTNNTSCTRSADAMLWIYAKYPPITLSWDKSAFSSLNCLENAFFSPNWLYIYSDPIVLIEVGGTVYACASKSDSLVWSLTRTTDYPNHVFTFIKEREVEGIGIDTIVGIFLAFPCSEYFSPCRIIVGAEEVPMPIEQEQSVKVWPNPATFWINIENQRAENMSSICLMESTGREIWSHSTKVIGFESFKHAFSKLSAGMYFLRIQWDDGFSTVRRWVVAD